MSAQIARIVVGVDFSAEAEVAIRHALVLARRLGARVALVHVGTVPELPAVDPLMGAAARSYEVVLAESFARARAALEELRARYDRQGVELSHDVVGGWPDGGLLEAAAALDAGLIVVGSHGYTGLRRAVLGSFAERTVRHADRPVLVARGEPPEDGYRRVLVGHDFTPPSERALDVALAFARAGAAVHVAHGWGLVMPAQGLQLAPVNAITAELRSNIAATLAARGEALLASRASSAVQLRFSTIEVGPGMGLPATAARDGSDLVVVGSHGRRGLRRWVIGSVAEETVRHAPCSVLVVR